MIFLVLLPFFLSSLSRASSPAPPILSQSLTSQLTPSNPAISSVFLIPSSSALLNNASGPFPALRVPPSWSFSIGFSGTTFLPSPGGPQKLSLTAQLDDGDPIPEWLTFAPDTNTFNGIAPKASRGIQTLKVIVTASSISNSTTSDTFILIVSPHDLSLAGPLLTRNVTANNTFTIVLDDWQGVQVDGASANTSYLTPNNAIATDWTMSTSEPSDLSLNLALDTSASPWLTYNPKSRSLSGTPPSFLAGAPGLTIPAHVTLTFGQPSQSLTVASNLTLTVVSALFTIQTLPVLPAPPGTKIAFALAPFLKTRASSTQNLNVSAAWNPHNVTWLSFDPAKLILSGIVPQDAPGMIEVVFLAQDGAQGTASRAEMRINVNYSDNGDGGRERLPTDRALRTSGQKIKLAVGVVFGLAAAVILLACFLAICRQCCVAREYVDGAYVIDQSAFDQGIPYKTSLDKHDYVDATMAGVDTGYLATSSPQVPSSLRLGRTMTKAAFFGAIRARFGSDGSWRTKRNAGRTRLVSMNEEANEKEKMGGSRFGSSKRARKSKISKPMVMLSSSTSVRDNFGERGQGGIGGLVNGKGKGINFTIFGGGNHAGSGGNSSSTNVSESSPKDKSGNATGVLSLRPARADLSLSIGRALISSPGTAILAYDRSRSNSDPSHGSARESTGSSGSPSAKRSGSAPSIGTGTHSGTQTTFATGDSTRLTNAAGEVPFRRPGFDGPWETLAERSMRETASPGPFFPPRAILKAVASQMPTSSHVEALGANTPRGRTPTPPKIGKSSKLLMTSESLTSATSNSPLKSIKSNPSNKSSPNHVTNSSSQFGKAIQSSMPTSMPTKPSAPILTSKQGSERSLGAPSSYRNIFLNDKGSESDSSTEDVEHAIIARAVKRSSSETPVLMSTSKASLQQTSGKPRLVPFTHEKTTPASGQWPRRDVSQKAVLQGGDESDADAEMRIGIEYVRQLGDPGSNYEAAHSNPVVNPKSSSSRLSLASDPTHTPSVEFYASNDSNNSMAGRARVLAPLVINSHRNRHHAAYSMASTHSSFVSLIEREGGQPRESHWMVEAALPRFAFGAKEPFNFAVPLDREHKHASALAGSALEAKQADGRVLPEWLRFDKGGKEFWGVTPKATRGEKGATLVTRVVVRIWDGEKGEVVGGCVVDVLGDKE